VTLSRAVEAAGTLYAPSSLHAARIATKKLRYSLEWSRLRGNPPALAGQLAELKSLQEILGRVQDLHTLQSTLRRIAARARVDRSTLRALHQAAADVETTSRQQHAQFVARIPAVLALTADLARTTPLSWIRRRPIRAGTVREADRVKLATNN
jgi:CHAD domain-containing protein